MILIKFFQNIQFTFFKGCCKFSCMEYLCFFNPAIKVIGLCLFKNLTIIRIFEFLTNVPNQNEISSHNKLSFSSLSNKEIKTLSC